MDEKIIVNDVIKRLTKDGFQKNHPFILCALAYTIKIMQQEIEELQDQNNHIIKLFEELNNVLKEGK